MEATIRTKPLLGTQVSFTGRLAAMSLHECRALVEELGGRYCPTVTRRTSLLVVGLGGWPLAEDGSVSRKIQQAEELRRRGGRIRILTETGFLKELGRSSDPDEASKSLSAESIIEITGLNPPQLQRLESLGLVESADGLYDYQDLVSLQSIANLLSHGIQPERIAGSLHRLRGVMSDVDRPLSQLKIIAENPKSLLLELDGRLRTMTGQFAFDFDSRISEPVDMCSLSTICPDWLALAEELEEQERYEEAEDALRQAIDASGDDAAHAWFNLGNVLRTLGRPLEAEDAFTAAIREDPTFARAYYNLADLQEERGDLESAIRNLHSAINADPGMADAYFNLAICFENLGQSQQAAIHWRTYLRLDSASDWAKTARDHLAKSSPNP